ncbi:MAG: hypothetical protein IIW09_01175, partial [Acetobacter sp.]|nr:hypothetical protein [Acetobacter sp.]
MTVQLVHVVRVRLVSRFGFDLTFRTTGHDPWFGGKEQHLWFKNKGKTKNTKRIQTKIQNDQVALSKRSPHKT